MFYLRFVSVIIHHSIASIIQNIKGLIGRILCYFSQVIYLVSAVITVLPTVIYFKLFLFVPPGPTGI